MGTTLQQFLKNNEKIIGTIASVLAIVMFTALLEILMSNTRGESHIFVQPIATAFNGFFWSLYAYGRKDWFLLWPNVLACILGIITGVSAFI
ncbi:MAG: SemiSWEET family transporter [Patescibacteria group bacterium]